MIFPKLYASIFFVLSLNVSLIAQTKIIAHRGFSSIAPENTLVAFQKAIDAGADYIELDVHQTKDGEIIVIHDKDIEKTSSHKKSGAVDNMTAKELAKIKVGYPTKFGNNFIEEAIPTLAEVLALAKNKVRVCVEVKVAGANEAILQVIQEQNMESEVIIFSFQTSVLEAFHTMAPEIPTLLLLAKKNKKSILYATSLHANAIGVGPVSNLTKQYVEKAHEAGLEIWKWTVNSPKNMEKLLRIPIDGIITNYPDQAITLRDKL